MHEPLALDNHVIQNCGTVVQHVSYIFIMEHFSRQ